MIRAWVFAVALLVTGPLGCLPDPPVPRTKQGAAGAQGLDCAAPAACDEGCVGDGYFPGPGGGCYHLSGQALPWSGALAACRGLGPGFDLAALSTEAERAAVAGRLGASSVWLGGSDARVEGQVEWSNGEPWGHVDGLPPWRGGEPDDARSDRALDCVALGDDGALGDEDCEAPMPFLCERPSTKGPLCRNGAREQGEECDDGNTDDTDGCSSACVDRCKGEGYFRDGASGSCYFAPDSGAAVPFADARAACRALGPGFDVVIPSTLAELQYLEGRMSAGTWIGLTDEQDTGKWTWLDGEPSSFINGAQPWSPGHPAGVEGQCAAFWDGKLWARDCSTGYTYACERPPAGCQEIRAFNAAAPPGRYLIDPDGAGGASAYRLYCDMNPTPGGRDPCEGQPSCEPLPRSCKEIFERDPGVKDGVFRVDPDGGGGVDGLDVFCDMTFEPGGWTMLMATARKGPSQMIKADSRVVPGSGSYLAPAFVFALTAPGVSSRVHVRTAGQAAGRSITSAEGALPWRNLHDLVLLNTGSILAGGSLLTPSMVASEWEGPFAQDHSRLWYSCNVSPYSPRPEPPLLEWPSVYMSCGNDGGLFLVSTYSTWSLGKQSVDNEDLEVYVR